MPSSSISSSDREDVMGRLPRTSCLRTIIVGALLCVVGLVAWEIYLHQHSAGNAPQPDVVRQAAIRAQAPRDSQRCVFVVGSSRMRFGMSPDDITAVIGNDWEIRNVAVDSTSGFWQLHESKSLFREDDIVVVGYTPRYSCRTIVEPTGLNFKSYLRQPTSLIRLEESVHKEACKHFYFVADEHVPMFEIRDQVRLLTGRKRVVTAHSIKIINHDNGWAEYVLDTPKSVDPTIQVKTSSKDPRAELAAINRRFQADLLELRQRGVDVFLIRPPSQGAYAQWEHKHYPRDEYWDRLAEWLPHRAWHFSDDPQTRDLKTFDESHLFSHQARIYSRVIATKLKNSIGGE